MLHIEKEKSNQTSPRTKNSAKFDLGQFKFGTVAHSTTKKSNSQFSNTFDDSMDDLQFGGGTDTLSPK